MSDEAEFGGGNDFKSASESMSAMAKNAAQMRKDMEAAAKAMKSASSGGGGGGLNGGPNILGNSMGDFGNYAGEIGNKLPLGLGIGLQVAGLGIRTYGRMVNAMPGINGVIDRAAGYYQAGISGGVGNRKMLEGTTFSALNGGLTSYGSDATVANILLGRGMNYSATPGSTYMQTLQGVKSAAQYLNMPNEQAADAIENLTSGPTSANMLMTYGIFTADPTTGKEKTQGQIFEEMWGRLTAGRGKMTTEETMNELRRGALGSSIRHSPLNEDQQRMFAQFAIEKSKGRTMDLSDAGAMKSMIDSTAAGGNANPLKAQQEIYSSETGRANNFEEGYIKGMQNTADILKIVNPALDLFTSNLAELQSTLTGLNSTDAGNFMLNTGKDVLKTGVDIVKGIFPALGAILPGSGDTMALPMSPGGGGGRGVGGTSMGMSSGGKPAFAIGSGGDTKDTANTQLRLIVPANGPITCQYGVVDENHPNGHHGIDYGVAKGSTVVAAAAGTVSYAGDNGSELGYQVWVDHGNGFVTGYCHLSTRSAQPGSRVEQGQEIAKSGNTGTNTTGAHLHFCLKKNGSYTNPNPYLGGGGGTVTTKTTKTTDGSTEEAGPPKMAVGDPGASGIVSTSSTGVAGGSSSPVGESGLTTINGTGFTKVDNKMSSKNSNSILVSRGYGSKKSGAGTDSGGGGMGLGMAGTIPTTIPGNSLAESMNPGSTGSAGSKNQVVINLQIAKATDDEARRFASVVKEYLENDKLMFNMGRQ